jgi:hypothetical protein
MPEPFRFAWWCSALPIGQWRPFCDQKPVRGSKPSARRDDPRASLGGLGGSPGVLRLTVRGGAFSPSVRSKWQIRVVCRGVVLRPQRATDSLQPPMTAIAPATKETIKDYSHHDMSPRRKDGCDDSQDIGTTRIKSIRQVLVPLPRVTRSREMPGLLSRIRERPLGTTEVSGVGYSRNGLTYQGIRRSAVEADQLRDKP